MFLSMPKFVDVAERRAQLAAAAARIIGRAGIGAVTLREVAAEAGWTELTERIAAGWSIARLTLNDEGAIAVEWVGC